MKKLNSRRQFSVLLLLAVLSGAAPTWAAETAPKRIGVGDVAPDFSLTDHEGRKHTLSAERGKRPMVLVFYRGHW